MEFKETDRNLAAVRLYLVQEMGNAYNKTLKLSHAHLVQSLINFHAEKLSTYCVGTSILRRSVNIFFN